MSGRQRTVVAIVVMVLAACSAGAPPSATTRASPDPSQDPPMLPTPSPLIATPTPPATADPTPKPTPVPVPPKPTGVTFKTDMAELPEPTGTDEITDRATHTVRWKTPRTADVEIRVYGVTECLSEPSDPSPGTSGPCLVEHTRLPASVMALAATAPAAAGEISWIAPWYYECAGPPVGPDGLEYQAIVIAAYNAAGHSVFAIAYPGAWWRAALDEVIC